MRWLMIVLLVSVVALLFACAGLAYHVLRGHKRRREALAAAEKVEETETEDTP